jgi:hypothetical protein
MPDNRIPNYRFSLSLCARYNGFGFLKRNHGRTLLQVMDAEIDISDVIQ